MAKNEEREPLLPTSGPSEREKRNKDARDPATNPEDRNILASKSPGKAPLNPALRLPKRLAS